MKRGKHADFDPFNRTTEIVGTAFYDQMVVLVSWPLTCNEQQQQCDALLGKLY